MKSFVFAACLFAWFPLFADWVPFASDSERTVTVYVDPDTKRVEKNIVRIWALYDEKKPQKLPSSEHYLSMKILWEYNCTNKMGRGLSLWLYEKNMGSGEPLPDISAHSPPLWEHIPPDTVGNNMLEAVCSKS